MPLKLNKRGLRLLAYVKLGFRLLYPIYLIALILFMMDPLNFRDREDYGMLLIRGYSLYALLLRPVSYAQVIYVLDILEKHGWEFFNNEHTLPAKRLVAIILFMPVCVVAGTLAFAFAITSMIMELIRFAVPFYLMFSKNMNPFYPNGPFRWSLAIYGLVKTVYDTVKTFRKPRRQCSCGRIH